MKFVPTLQWRVESRRAGVVQWQYRSFPSFGRGFDSHRPLQFSKSLCCRLFLHIFENINHAELDDGICWSDPFKRKTKQLCCDPSRIGLSICGPSRIGLPKKEQRKLKFIHS